MEDAEAETPILWSPDVKSLLTGKDPDAGKDWRQEEKGMTEDEVVRWHHWLGGHEFEQVLGIGDGQGSLVFCSPWGRKELDTTEWLNWTENAEDIMVKCFICLISLNLHGDPVTHIYKQNPEEILKVALISHSE